MRKYFAVAKILFKAQIVYRFDVALTALATIWRVLFARILWGAVFESRETVGGDLGHVGGDLDHVGGFTYQAMLSYYIVSAFLASVDMSNGVLGEMTERIRGGTFSKYMVIPANPRTHFLAQCFGSGCYYALFSALAAVLCVFLFGERGKDGVILSLARDPEVFVCAAVMVPLGLAFMVFYQYFIGTFAFKFQDIGFFTHIQGSVITFFTGGIVPLALLPQAVIAVLRYLPFTYVTYMPAMLLTGRAGAGEGFFGLAVIAVWTAAMAAVCRLTYNRFRVKFDGVGI